MHSSDLDDSLAGKLGDALPDADTDIENRRIRAAVEERLFGRAETALRIGRFVVLERIGAGAMGMVYAAYDPELDRKIALKLVRFDGVLAGLADARERVLDEARAAARLSHPNVVSVFDVGTYDGHIYIAMELVDGVTLTHWLRAQPGWREIVPIFVAAGRGLAAAHAAGVIHRDFKPDNVLVGDPAPAQVCVVDFGLAAASDPDRAGDQAGPREIAGTPAYMAPEQLAGGSITPAADQFGFCVALYEALYQVRPFAGQSRRALLASIAAGAVERTDAQVPRWLERVLLRGLRADPGQRYPDMDALLLALCSDPAARRRRWIARIALALVSAGAAASLVALLQAPVAPGDRCNDAARALDDTWSQERKRLARERFLALDVPYASATWAAVERQLDSYARAWTTMRGQACRATYEQGAQSESLLDLRMRCLDRRRQRLRALVERMLESTPEIAKRAVDAVHALPGLDECASPALLQRPHPLPEDPAIRQAIAALEQRLDEAQTLRSLGRYAEGTEAAAASSAEARALDYAPLAAEALLVEGTLREKSGDIEAAAKLLHQAFATALAGRSERIAAQSAVALVWVHGYWRRDQERADLFRELASALLRGMGGDAGLESDLRDHEGSRAFLREAYEEAEAHHRAALALLAQAHGDTDAPEAVRMQINLSAALVRQERLGQAEDVLRQTLALAHRHYGAAHPAVASVLTNLSVPLQQTMRLEEALDMNRRALVIKEATMGRAHPSLASNLNNIALNLAALGRLRESIPYVERAVAIRRQSLGPEHPSLINTLINLAHVYVEAGELAAGLREVDMVIALVEKHHGAQSSELAYPFTLRGRALLGMGKPRAAVAVIERALGLVDPAFPYERAETHAWLAQALVATGGNRARARALADQARALYQDLPPDAEAVTGLQRVDDLLARL